MMKLYGRRYDFLWRVVIVLIAHIPVAVLASAETPSWSGLTYLGSVIDKPNFYRFCQKIASRPVSGQSQGWHHPQEDALIFSTGSDVELLGVADGHGGGRMSAILADKERGIAKHIKALDGDYNPEALTQAFLNLQKENVDEPSGSTLSVVINPLEAHHPYYYVANIADSPVFVVYKNGDILRTTDHDYKNFKEVARMQNHRVIFHDNRFWTDESGLQVSKDFGQTAQVKGFEPTPSVYRVKKSDVAFILTASDGINDGYFKKMQTESEKGLIDDLIREALKISPNNLPFTASDIQKIAHQYGSHHSDDMSLVIFGGEGRHALSMDRYMTPVCLGAALSVPYSLVAVGSYFLYASWVKNKLLHDKGAVK